MNDFDKTALRAIKEDPANFYDWFLPGLQTDFLFVDWFDARQLPFPGEKDRYCDTVARFDHRQDPNSSWLVVTEVLSEPQGIILPRMFNYGSNLYLELQGREETRRYQIGLAILDLTGPPQAHRIDMQIPSSAGGSIQIQVARRCLREEEAAPLLDQILAGRFSRWLLPWIPLMRGGDQPDIIEKWKAIAEAESDWLKRHQLAALAKVLAELTDRQYLWQNSLGGLERERISSVE